MQESKRYLIKKQIPAVSICTLTHNRAHFLPRLQRCIESQTYPLDKIEWVILDDSTTYAESLRIKSHSDLRIKYQRINEKLSLGAKRNLSHKLCSGEIIVYMDDDDYYFSERVSHAVETLEKSAAGIAGSTTLHIYFSHDDSLWISGPFGAKHATAGTFAMTREFALGHAYDNAAQCNEEKSFLENYTLPIAQLNPLKTMVCISHQQNTFDKKRLRHSGATARMKPAPEQEREKICNLLSKSGHRPPIPRQEPKKQTSNLQKIALISGPWGSGTSALCQIIANLGVNTPGPYFQTNDPRTKNSFELIEFNRLVNKCIKETTLTKNLPDEKIGALIHKFSKEIGLQSKNNLIALKTPASSALLNELSEHFNMRLILCLRNYNEIENSRKRRGWPSHLGLQGAIKIYAQINEFIANTDTPFLFVRYSDFTDQSTAKRTINEISKFLNIRPTPESIDNAIRSIRTNTQVTNKPTPKLEQ